METLGKIGVTAIILIIVVIITKIFMRLFDRKQRKIQLLNSDYAKILLKQNLFKKEILALLNFKENFTSYKFVNITDSHQMNLPTNGPNMRIEIDLDELIRDTIYLNIYEKQAQMELMNIFEDILKKELKNFADVVNLPHHRSMESFLFYWRGVIKTRFPNYLPEPWAKEKIKIFTDCVFQEYLVQINIRAKNSNDYIQASKLMAEEKLFETLAPKIMLEEGCQKMILNELAAFKEKGEINADFIDYLKRDSPPSIKFLIKKTFDEIAYAEIERKLCQKNIEPTIEIVQAYNRFLMAIAIQ